LEQGETPCQKENQPEGKDMLKKMIKCEAGATAIEYGLIAAGIAVAIAVVVFALGSKLNQLFSNINGMLP
jgi:pilus assembly protein Flp/PilA